MASEWEELEKLTKDELIIELVKERYKRRLIDHKLRMIVELDYPVENRIPLFSDDEDECEGMTSEDWAYRIARYAYEHCEDKSDFDPYCPMDYGLDEDQSTEAYRRLRADGIITDSSKDLAGWFRWSTRGRSGDSTAIPTQISGDEFTIDARQINIHRRSGRTV